MYYISPSLTLVASLNNNEPFLAENRGQADLLILSIGCHSTCSISCVAHTPCTLASESIQCIIEDQAFSPRKIRFLPILQSASCLSFSIFLCVVRRAYWLEGGGEKGAKSYDGEKAWPSTIHCLLSAWNIASNHRKLISYAGLSRNRVRKDLRGLGYGR